MRAGMRAMARSQAIWRISPAHPRPWNEPRCWNPVDADTPIADEFELYAALVAGGFRMAHSLEYFRSQPAYQEPEV